MLWLVLKKQEKSLIQKNTQNTPDFVGGGFIEANSHSQVIYEWNDNV